MIREQRNGRARLAVDGRSRSSRSHRQQLCSASPDQTRPASRIDRRSASSTRQSRAWHAARAEPAAAGGAGPAIGTARVCRLPRMRISQANAAPASAGAPRARGRRVPRPLEPIAQSPGDGTGLFQSPLDNGEGNRARPQVGPDRAPTRANAAAPAAAANTEVVKPGSRAGGKATLMDIYDTTLYH